MSDRQQQRLEQEKTLAEIDSLLKGDLSVEALYFKRANLLLELGRLEEAKKAYLEIIRWVPDGSEAQFVALNNLGKLLRTTGYYSAAITAYRELARKFPDRAMAHVNLAHTLYASHEYEEAQRHYEIGLRLEPGHKGAHQGMAYLLMHLGRRGEARAHQEVGFEGNALTVFPYYGAEDPVRLLFLVSALGGNVPFNKFLDRHLFQVSQLTVEYHDPEAPLPPHDIVFNAIGDVDLDRKGLEVAEVLLRRAEAPVINHPARIMPTDRISNSRRLAAIPDVRTPRIARMSKGLLAAPQAVMALSQHGLQFPLLLRAVGFHGGDHFVRVETPEEMVRVLPELPGDDVLAIEYLDARAQDGKIRKYRVMMVGGKIYPLHAAVARQWKIHYFSADMIDSEEHRQEDAAFLENMEAVLPPRALRALQGVCDFMGLDYGGIDFSVDQEGQVLLFEANATMVVPAPPTGSQWDYRRGPVERINDAVRDLLLGRLAKKA